MSDLVVSDGGGTALVMDDASLAELHAALARLTAGDGLLVRLSGVVGGMAGRAMRFGLPGGEALLRRVTEGVLRRAFGLALMGLGNGGFGAGRVEMPLVVASGAVGGALGFAGFLPDAGVTTLTILREVARIAQRNGEVLTDPATREACLQVLALNGGEPEANYFATRLAFSGQPFSRIVTDVAARYGVNLSQKIAAQAVPVVGAVSGAALNAVFFNHYRNLAEGHFTVRRLERQFGAETVRAASAGAPASGAPA